MNILIKNAKIMDSSSPYHGNVMDILVENGIIKKIATTIPSKKEYQKIELDGLHVSQGWFDGSVSFGEPGYEERETIAHGLEVAAKSGFTGIALNPNTQPVIDSSASVAFLRGKANQHLVDLFPIGTLTKNADGVDLAELYDMKQAGAVAFGDYKKPIENPNLLKIALQYTQSFNGIVISFPQDIHIAGKGVMNEEHQSTLLGLKGIPALAEELQISRDLFLVEYSGGRLHIPTISTKKAVDLIRKAKKDGIQVTCSTAVHHLSLTDSSLNTFDTNYKVLPPLRTQKDIDELLIGIEDGTIDTVISDHQPIDIEQKKVEFSNAAYGTIGLETSFGILNNLVGTERAITLLTNGKRIYGLNNNAIEIGNIANLSLFEPEASYHFTKDHIMSTSKNSAFLGMKLKGRPYGVLNNGKIILNA